MINDAAPLCWHPGWKIMLDKLTQYGTFNGLAREFVTLPTATVQTRPANMSALVSSAVAAAAGLAKISDWPLCSTPLYPAPPPSSSNQWLRDATGHIISGRHDRGPRAAYRAPHHCWAPRRSAHWSAALQLRSYKPVGAPACVPRSSRPPRLIYRLLLSSAPAWDPPAATCPHVQAARKTPGISLLRVLKCLQLKFLMLLLLNQLIGFTWVEGRRWKLLPNSAKF